MIILLISLSIGVIAIGSGVVVLIKKKCCKGPNCSVYTKINVEPPQTKETVVLYYSDVKRIDNITSTDEECIICYDKYKNNDLVRRIQCKHYYHKHCIDHWLNQKTTCPMCIRNVVVEV